MNNSRTVEWLFETGGPVIRHLLAMSPLGKQLITVPETLEHDLLNSGLVQKWLARITFDLTLNGMHGSKPTCWENFMGKLTDLGCHKGMPEFDLEMKPFLEWLDNEYAKPPQDGRSI